MTNPQAVIVSKLTGLEQSMTVFSAEQREIRQLISQLRCDVADGFALHGNATRASIEVGQQSPCADIHAVRSEALDAVSRPLSADTIQGKPAPVIFGDRSPAFGRASFPDPDGNSLLAISRSSVSFCNSIVPLSDEGEFCMFLDANWPKSLQVRTSLVNLEKTYEQKEIKDARKSMAPIANQNSNRTVLPSVEAPPSSLVTRTVILPTSRMRLTLDSIGVIFLAWDLVLTPLQLAWEFDVEGGLLLFSRCIAIFWTLDVFFNFRTAYYRKNGDVETQSVRIARKYLRRGFLLDLLVIISDWLTIIVGVNSGNLRLARIAKVSKIIRLVRVFRVLRLHHLDDFISLISGVGRPIFEGVKLACLTIYCAHVFACMWFVIGKLNSSDTGFRWLDETWATGSPTLLEAPTTFQYVSAIQWTLSSILSGSTVVFPRNTVEQIICCSIIMCGLLFQAFAVSMLSSAAVEHKANRRNLEVILKSLSSFCTAQQVSTELTLAARSQAKEVVTRQSNARNGIKEVEGLRIISSKLRLSVLHEVFEPHLSRHALFFLWSQIDTYSYSKLLSRALDMITVRDKHDIFMASEAATHAYLVSFGEAKYLQDPHSSKVVDKKTIEVRQDRWMSEAALWTDWTHVGTLQAASYECTVCCIAFENFLPIVESSMVFKDLVGAYAVGYHRCLTNSVPPLVPWPSDVDIHGTDFEQIIPTLPASVQRMFDSLALGGAVSMGFVGDEIEDVLDREIREGKSNLILTKVASRPVLQRVVALIRISVRRGDDIFAQLGSWSDGQLTPKCMLPGQKRKGAENIQALINNNVEQLETSLGKLDFVSIEFTDEHATSNKTGIPTHYSVVTAHYQVPLDAVPSITSAMAGVKSEARTSSRLPRGLSRPSLRTSKTIHSLDKKLQHSNSLIIVETRANKTFLCTWLNTTEMQFFQSQAGIDMLTSLSSRGDLRPLSAQDIETKGASSFQPLEYSTEYSTRLSEPHLAI